MYEDIYNAPHKYGLEIVGEVSWDNDAYQFDMSVVWKTTEPEEYYLGDDSGCSCPSPFEDVDSIESVDGPYTSHQVISQLQSRWSRVFEDSDYRSVESSDAVEAKQDIAEIAERLFS